MSNLDPEEAELLHSFEAGEWQTVPEMPREIRRHQQIAAATFKKDQRINIRLSSRDLTELKKRASLEGIPYQTLITSILHKYVNGRLKDPSYA